MLGKADLMSLPMPEEHGGGGQPYEVYLQVLEELAARWASVALGISVHTLACHPMLDVRDRACSGSPWQQASPRRSLLGAYCLSEAHAGSDPAAMRAAATA